jgi:hypothetical protein
MFSQNTYPVNKLPARLLSITEHYLGSWCLFILHSWYSSIKTYVKNETSFGGLVIIRYELSI